MEQRSAQEMTALMDMAYVVCFGHFPDQIPRDGDPKPRSKDPKAPAAENGAESPSTPPNSPLDESNPFTDSSRDDGNLFGEEDDGNPFSEDDNPFEDDGNPFGESGEDLNPFGEDEVDGQSSKDDSKAEEGQNPQDPAQEQTSSASPSSTPSDLLVTPPPITPRGEIDPNSPLGIAMSLKDVGKVSQIYAKEIVAEAFNLTKLDLCRLVEETGNTKDSPAVELLLEKIRTEGLPVSPLPETYPLLFLRARIGKEEGFTNFSSTSATNTIQQSLTLGIRNMYNDILTLEVWSANIVPAEEPQAGHKLDLLGRIMTGSMRLKKDDPRHLRMTKQLKDTSGEDPNTEESDKDTSFDISYKTPGPQGSDKGTVNVVDESTKGNEIQNGDMADHEDLSHSLDMSDSISVTSEMSNDPLSTSTPRGRSSSLQHLEATNIRDNFQRKKGFRSSFKQKAGSFLRSSQSNLRKSNQSLSAESGSPSLSPRAPDTHSIQSESSDLSSHGPDISGRSEKSKLDRETSKSNLSISSITRRTLSMRLSTKKALSPLKKFGGSMRVKKGKDIPGAPEDSPNLDNHSRDAALHIPNQQNGIQSPGNSTDTSFETQLDIPKLSIEDAETVSPKSSSRKLMTPRQMRPFKNLKLNLKSKGDVKGVSPDINPVAKSPTEKVVKTKIPNNPIEIQKYLTEIGKEHLQAERIAYANIKIKGIVGEWVKECWVPMTLTPAGIKNVTQPIEKKKKKKGNKISVENEASKNIEKDAKVLCKMHVRLAIPAPLESELGNSAFDTYNSTYNKLVSLQLQSITDLSEYKGNVGVVGKVLLEQLIFFSRVSVHHQTLVYWLVLANKRPSDSTLLLPFLTVIREGLHDGKYITAQKLKMGESLSKWVRHVMQTEFEMLHSSFPPNSHLLHLPRLEHFLRCFYTIEEDSELRILFEREMNLINLPSLTDQLKGALSKNAEIWIEALNNEPVNTDTSLNIEASEVTTEEAKWHDALRRAAHLTKPIEDFLVVCGHTYQPIFTTEMAIDYLYCVLPHFLTAALHLINKTHQFSLSKIQKLPKAFFPSAAQASWKICCNLSSINKIGITNRLPVHLIEQEYRAAYSNTVLQWLALSEELSIEEISNDVIQDDFVAVDLQKGYSHSAISMADILKAVMSRLKGLCWPGGLRPGTNTLARIGKQIISLVVEYTNKITDSYETHGNNNDRIATEVCVMVRNVEHVCDEARQHLSDLASWAEEPLQVQEELPPQGEGNQESGLDSEARSRKLQEQISFTAERLLRRCLPNLEQTLTHGVSKGNPELVVESLATALQLVEDRLYFAEPLLHELWHRLFQHALCLKQNFLQGQWRSDLQRLQKCLTAAYSFLTDTHKVGFELTDEAINEYTKFIEELKMVGASSPGLVAKYYTERYYEQCKEIGSDTTPVIVANILFCQDGLRVYIAQAPGNARSGTLVKARVEPQEWFPNSLPQKTRLVKGDQAVFDETLHFYEVDRDCQVEDETSENRDVGGVLVLQLRTPKLFRGSVVHHEAIIPLATVQRINEEDRHTIQHLRLPLTRPWSFSNYKSLETLRTRVHDNIAMTFLKALQTRWEGSDDAAMVTPESLKLNSSFIRAGSLRLTGMNSRRKASLRDTPVK